jgi:hypothetical protein
MLLMRNVDNLPGVYAVRQRRDGAWLSYAPPADPGCPPQEVQLVMPVGSPAPQQRGRREPEPSMELIRSDGRNHHSLIAISPCLALSRHEKDKDYMSGCTVSGQRHPPSPYFLVQKRLIAFLQSEENARAYRRGVF